MIFSDCYNLLYGHHMDNGGMFGDLDKYKDADFFDGHITGTLLLPRSFLCFRGFRLLCYQRVRREYFQPGPLAGGN